MTLPISTVLVCLVTVVCSLRAMASGFQSWSGTSGTGIVDLALIYQGGLKRLAWTPDQLAPYLSWTNPATHKEEWLYDGFLFIEFRDFKSHEYAKGYGGKPARKTEWEWLLQRNFAAGHAVAALDETIGAVSRRIGKPKRTRQVVLTLPEPIFGQTDWGELKGRALSFTNTADRIAACTWHMDRALALWKQHAPTNLELAGFYWVAEHTGSATNVLPQVAKEIHARGKKFYWIPYWRAAGAARWKEMGFDAAYQQPNHFFKSDIPDSRLVEACVFARQHEMGMEVEFDSRAIKSPLEFRPRLHAYLSTYTREGVKKDAALAWYEGGGTLLEFALSQEIEVRQLYEVVAAYVAERQQAADH